MTGEARGMGSHERGTDSDSLSKEQDRRAGDLLSEVIRRLCVVRSEGAPQLAAYTKLYIRKRIGIS